MHGFPCLSRIGFIKGVRISMRTSGLIQKAMLFPAWSTRWGMFSSRSSRIFGMVLPTAPFAYITLDLGRSMLV